MAVASMPRRCWSAAALVGGEDFGDVAGLDSHGALGGEGDEARSGFSGDLKFERNKAIDLIPIGGRSTNLNENSMRPREGEHERTNGVAFSKQFPEESDLGAYFHVRLGYGTDNLAVFQDHAHLVGLEGHFGLPGDIGVVHVVGNHGWVGSPSEMHFLHLFVSPSMYMFLSRYMFRVRVSF